MNRVVWIIVIAVVVSAVVLVYVECPDSLFACLAVVVAAEVVSSMLRMCDRLLDPPPVVFQMLFRPNWRKRYWDED